MEKDELTHAAYWQYLGWEDPTPPEKQAEFALCGAQCGSDLHNEAADKGKYAFQLADTRAVTGFPRLSIVTQAA